MAPTGRREFLRDATLGPAATMITMMATRLGPLAAAQASAGSRWRSKIGLELYTVRDLLATDYEGTLAKVAAMGYTEVEPTSYNNMSPRDFRAMLDRYKLTMPSTHSAARGEGAELEKMLEGFQVMGIKYTEIQAGAARGGGPAATGAAGARGAGAAGARAGGVAGRPANLPPGAYYDAGTGIVHNAFKETEAFGPYQPPVTLESVKRRAADLNTNGRVAQKFGMKMLIHNHTGEFEKLSDSPRTTFDVLIQETDPSLVTMQIDLGWTYIAGVDPI